MTLPNDGSVLWGPRWDQNGDFRRMLLGGVSVPLPAPRPDQEEAGKGGCGFQKGDLAACCDEDSSLLASCSCAVSRAWLKFSDFQTMMEY